MQCTYRDSFDLIFRDQTWQVAQRYQQAHSQHSPHSLRGITSSTEQLVFPFFLSYFSSEYSSHDENIVHWLSRTVYGAEDNVLAVAISAVGYAIFSNVHHSAGNTITARVRYGKALRLMSRAVQDSIPPNAKDLLMAITLLAMFEVCSQ